jgi:uncharacterized protein YjbI with pentapeptide repeats
MKSKVMKGKELLQRYRSGERDFYNLRIDPFNFSMADLRSIVLMNSDLTGSVFSGANLCDANLRGANLQGVDFTWATMRHATLCYADLTGARLSGADLFNANLEHTELLNADLSNARLYNADLSNVYLDGTILCSAQMSESRLSNVTFGLTSDLFHTCLDPRLLANQKDIVRQCRVKDHSGLIVYRTKTSQHQGNTVYLPGHTYRAPVLSFSAETPCHPGIYAGTLSAVRERFDGEGLVKCYVRNGDWVVTFKHGMIRCSAIRVLEDIPSALELREMKIMASINTRVTQRFKFTNDIETHDGTVCS